MIKLWIIACLFIAYGFCTYSDKYYEYRYRQSSTRSMKYDQYIANCSYINLDLLEIPDTINTSVTFLDVSRNAIKEIQNLEKLMLLTKINLNYNFIEYVEFPYIPTLEYLNIAYNNITSLENVTLKSVQNIKYVNLSHNPIQDALSLSSRSLISLDLSYCNIKYLKTPLLESLENLEYLYLNNNPIKIIDALISFTLKNLDLSEIRIFFIRSNTIEQLDALIKLNLCKNKNFRTLAHNPQNEPLINYNLKIFDISYNDLFELSLNNLPNLEILNVSHNIIENLTENTFYYNKNLKMIKLSYNKIKYIHEKTFIKLQNIVELDLSYNFITTMSWISSASIKSLHLFNNKILNITFFEPRKMQYLDISQNLLTTMYDLNYTPNIKFLNISDNKLTNLKPLFSNTLQELILDNCQLYVIPNHTFDGLKNLQILSLNNNKLKEINTIHFNKTKNLKVLKLSNNPWNCNCSSKDFQYLYLYIMQHKLSNENELFCPPNVHKTWHQFCKIQWSKNMADLESKDIHSSTTTYSVISVICFTLVAFILCCIGWRVFRRVPENTLDIRDIRSLSNSARLPQYSPEEHPVQNESFLPPSYDEALLMSRPINQRNK